jgi:hypothetical protein
MMVVVVVVVVVVVIVDATLFTPEPLCKRKAPTSRTR